MNIRLRKLIGAIGLLLLISVYAVVAMAIGIRVLQNASPLTEFVYYLVAGLAWVLPAGLIIRWMEKPTREAGRHAGAGQR